MEPGDRLVVLSSDSRWSAPVPKWVYRWLAGIAVVVSLSVVATPRHLAMAAAQAIPEDAVGDGEVGSGEASKEEPSSTRRVQVSAQRFHFVPARVTLPFGDQLELELTSLDVAHGFKVPGTGIDVTIPQAGRGSVVVVFDPPAPGRYRFRCSHQCGAGHASMTGVIVVKGGRKND